MKIVIPALVLAIILESSVVSFPLTLIVLIFSAIFVKESYVFLLAFMAGLILDFLALRLIGISSLIFVTYVFLIYQYSQKFEVKTLHFFATFIFLGSYIYLLITNSSNAIFVSSILTLISAISFILYKKSSTTKKKLSYF